MRKYRIICLKRSYFAKSKNYDYTSDWFNCGDTKIVYWQPNANGYTDDRALAGLYTGLEIEEINGVHLDWLLDPVGRDE